MNCKDCPSFIPADQVAIEFGGKTSGSPMCKRFGYVLGRPELDDATHEAIGEHYASECDFFGKERPKAKPIEYQSRVVHSDPAALALNGGKAATLDTCRNCKNCVGNMTVRHEIGYGLDLCRAKGSLIMNPRNECKGCPFATDAAITDPSNFYEATTLDLELVDQYKPGFRIPVEKAIQKFMKNARADVLPNDYPTDKPLVKADIDEGIRAWRKVTDPNGSGNYTFLPIFNESVFTKDERSLIPRAGDDTHPELYVDYAGLLYSFAVDAYEMEETLALQGEPGLGKTEAARMFAFLMQVPFRRISFTESSEIDDIIGKMVFEDGETRFHEGRLVDAYKRPGVLVLDELNAAPDAIRQALRPLFDNNKQLVLDQGKGNIVSRNENCFFVLAQNPSWDHRNSGLFEAADADYNRLSVVEVPYPPEAVERHIITERCKLDEYEIPQKTLDAILKIAEDIREASRQGSVPFTWGIRQQIKVARKTQFYGLVDSYRKSALDFYEPQVREIVITIINSHTEG